MEPRSIGLIEWGVGRLSTFRTALRKLNELHSTLALTLGGNRDSAGSAEWTERRAAKLDALRAIMRVAATAFVTLERAQLEAPATATQQQGAAGRRDAALP